MLPSRHSCRAPYQIQKMQIHGVNPNRLVFSKVSTNFSYFWHTKECPILDVKNGTLFPQIKVINLWLASFFEAELDSKSHPKVLNRKTCSYWCTPRPSSAARWQLRWSWSLQPPSRNQRIGSWLLSSTGLLLQEHALFVQLPSISPSYWRTLQDSTQRWKTLY